MRSYVSGRWASLVGHGPWPQPVSLKRLERSSPQVSLSLSLSFAIDCFSVHVRTR